jgi:phage terminase Nu1 subunit (DNA packaging protein)
MAERRVNKVDVAELLGVSTVAIGQWVAKGCPFVQKGGQGKSWVFDVPEVVAWRERQVAQQAVGDTKSLDLDEARRRKLAAEAAMSELDLAKRKGELIEIEEVAAVVGDDYANVRAKLLSLPTKLGPQLIGVEEPAEAMKLVERAVTEALEELTADGIYGSPEEGAEEPEAGEPQAAA